MIVTEDGYGIEFYPQRNKIEIILPQTLNTITRTDLAISNRKEAMTSEEMLEVLALVMMIIKGEEE